MLGINTVYLSVADAKEWGFNRVEISPSPHGTKQERQKKMIDEMEYAKLINMPFSFHLPVYVFDWFHGRDLDAFFLDSNNNKSNMSMNLLEENLKRLSDCGVDYLVTHFSGVYRDSIRTKKTDEKARTALLKMQDIASKYGLLVYVEYMGGNRSFSEPELWLEYTHDLSNVGILVDTGHLYFSCELHGFDFEKKFELLRPNVDAFHFWSIFGHGAYESSEAYKKNHHIMPRIEQTRDKGWAFDTEDVFIRMKKTGKPIVLEATSRYNGREYFDAGAKEMLELEKN